MITNEQYRALTEIITKHTMPKDNLSFVSLDDIIKLIVDVMCNKDQENTNDNRLAD